MRGSRLGYEATSQTQAVQSTVVVSEISKSSKGFQRFNRGIQGFPEVPRGYPRVSRGSTGVSKGFQRFHGGIQGFPEVPRDTVSKGIRGKGVQVCPRVPKRVRQSARP